MMLERTNQLAAENVTLKASLDEMSGLNSGLEDRCQVRYWTSKVILDLDTTMEASTQRIYPVQQQHQKKWRRTTTTVQANIHQLQSPIYLTRSSSCTDRFFINIDKEEYPSAPSF